MSTAVAVDSAKLPKSARDAIARNELAGKNWIVINLSTDPPALIMSGELTRTQWVDAVGALGHQAKELV